MIVAGKNHGKTGVVAICVAIAVVALIAVGRAGAADSPGPAVTPHKDIVLPKPAEPFSGHIGTTSDQSTPDFPEMVAAPDHAPNILLILTDDVGFAASGTFGGPIATPNLDALAATGLKYNEFHTTAMCSPTRASLLTGRNHHAVATGTVVDLTTGYPGYWSMIPKSAATVAEILRLNGYNTAFFGKHHNVPAWQGSAAGPFDLWPTGLGFEYFYGFIGGDTNQWEPTLYQGTSRVDMSHKDPNYILDRDLADQAINWIHNQKASAPDKPFFAYYAPGSGHAPHQAPADWIARFKGKFDAGWDKLREESFARQKAAGIIPAATELTPRPTEIPAWDSLTPEQKRVDARYMEVFAGVLAFQDDQIGRVIAELKRMDLYDNTLIMFVEGDNGASGEGGPAGSANELGEMVNGMQERPGWMLDMMDHMGGPHTYELYPAGWAWSLDTPFQWFKQVASHLGGTRNGLVVSWPARIKARGEMRSQFHHVVDIMPTILDAVGVAMPDIVDGARQQPVDGISMTYTFDAPDAPSRHTTQYFEMLGNRGMYQDGWMASTTPAVMPWDMAKSVSPDSYKWELYDLRDDYSQAHDLAAQQPEKLKALQDLWMAEAQRNNVLPLDNSKVGKRGVPRAAAAMLAYGRPDTRYLFWGKGISVATGAAPVLTARSFSLEADVVVPKADATGVIAATGSRFGGWSFYLKDGKPVAYESFSQQPQDQFRVASAAALPAGPATIRYDFDYDGGGMGRGGLMRVSVNGKEVARGRIDRTITITAGLGETFDIGRDTGAPVTDDYGHEGAFPGDIRKVEVDLQQFKVRPDTPVPAGEATPTPQNQYKAE